MISNFSCRLYANRVKSVHRARASCSLLNVWIVLAESEFNSLMQRRQRKEMTNVVVDLC